MARNSLKYELNKRTFESEIQRKDKLSDQTITNYKHYNAQFRDFCQRIGVNTFDKLQKQGKAVLASYVEDMESRGLSASTIHSYLSAPCKALGIHMQDVEKPKRITAKGSRSAGVESARSGAEKMSPEYREAYRFCEVAGIRKREAMRLTGDCITRDDSGWLYVLVKSGKGGKYQRQRILPEHEEIVLEAFNGKAPDERIFSGRQFSKNINYHLARAKHAQEAYRYYRDHYQTEGARAKLAGELVNEYRSALIRSLESGKIKSVKELERRTEHFAREVIRDREKPYFIRGANKALAESKGMPVEYDRLALMAVSVFHLSHWRLDVTVTNYMVK